MKIEAKHLACRSLDDYVSETNPVRVVDVFVDKLGLATWGFDGVIPAGTVRPSYHPAILLKLSIYGYPTASNRADALREKPNATSN
jgi:transposase